MLWPALAPDCGGDKCSGKAVEMQWKGSEHAVEGQGKAVSMQQKGSKKVVDERHCTGSRKAVNRQQKGSRKGSRRLLVHLHLAAEVDASGDRGVGGLVTEPVVAAGDNGRGLVVPPARGAHDPR